MVTLKITRVMALWLRIGPRLRGVAQTLAQWALAVVACSPFVASSALACSDASVRGDIVGVAPDGVFVYRHETSTGAADGRTVVLDILDVHARRIVAFSRCDGDDCADEGLGARWRVVPGHRPPAWAQAVVTGDPSTRQLANRIKRHLGLRPLQPSGELVRVRHEPDVCASFVVKSGTRQATVFRLFEMPFSCAIPIAKTMRAQKSHPLSFLRYSYVSKSGCHLTVTDTHWYPSTRFDAEAKFRLARAAARRLEWATATKLAEEALDLERDNLEYRRLVVHALHESGASLRSAARTLERYPYSAYQEGDLYPRGGHCESQARRVWFEKGTLPRWEDDEGFDAWLDAEVALHDARHAGSADNPQNAVHWVQHDTEEGAKR